jgi:hypothetical protein
MEIPEAIFNEHGVATNTVKIYQYSDEKSRCAADVKAARHNGEIIAAIDVMCHQSGSGEPCSISSQHFHNELTARKVCQRRMLDIIKETIERDPFDDTKRMYYLITTDYLQQDLFGGLF